LSHVVLELFKLVFGFILRSTPRIGILSIFMLVWMLLLYYFFTLSLILD
jgi:hypothetical protein